MLPPCRLLLWLAVAVAQHFRWRICSFLPRTALPRRGEGGGGQAGGQA